MLMRSPDSAGRKRDNARIDVPSVHCDVRQIMVEYCGVIRRLGRLSLCTCYGSGFKQR